jgi:hypothetical protein
MPPSSAASAFSTTRRLPDPARNLSGQARGQAITVAELIGDDHVLFGPQRQHRLVPAIAVVRAFGGTLVAADHRSDDIQGCRLHRPTALQIEDEFALALAKPNSGTVSAATGYFALLQQRQVLGMELRQKVARRLRRRQVVAEQQRQRLVLAKLIEILGVFIRRLHGRQAFDHLRDAQTPLAALQPDLPVDHRRGLVWRNASINPRTPAWPMISPVSSSTPISKSSRSATLAPGTPRVKATIHQKIGRIDNLHANSAESTPLAGD